MQTPLPDDSALEAQLLALAAACDPTKTFCPSEAARAIAGPQPDAWGRLMLPVRRAAVKLAQDGRLVVYRKGKTVDPSDFKGVYRLGPPRRD